MTVRWILICGFIFSCSQPVPRPTSSPRIFQVSADKKAKSMVTGKKWMISTQGEASSRAGVRILKEGGNLFDAAVAVSFAIAVERPHSTGLGGGGFLLIRDGKTGQIRALDFRERAPLKAYANMYLDKTGKVVSDRSLTGALAVGTPGLVMGLVEIHQKYGSLPLEKVMAPAIELAEKGFPVYPALFQATISEKERLLRFAATRKIFLDSQSQAWPVGHQLIQTDLGKTLRLISKKGSAGFYHGPIAKKMSDAMKQQKALLSLQDFSQYQTRWREPVSARFANQNLEIFSMPPPSSGGVHVLQILNILENDDLKSWGPQDVRSVHLTASAMQMAFADRAQYLGDPDFVQVPVPMLISKSYAQLLRKKISMQKATRSDTLPIPLTEVPKESSDTMHFSMMDNEGNIIATTQTINGLYGSAFVVPGTGILMNNEMDDFAAQVNASNLFGAVGGKHNLIEPLKRPLSSMSPTIVTKDGKPWLTLGTPSGTRIITCVAQTLLNRLRYDLPLWDSVALTRYHHQWKPEVLRIEEPYLPELIEDQLQALGHKITHESLGCRIQAIEKTTDELIGVSDPREEGLSIGE